MKKTLYFFILINMLASSFLYASDDDDKPWWGGTEDSIMNTPCQGAKEFSAEILIAEIQKIIAHEKRTASENIHGAKIQNENIKLIKAFKRLTTVPEDRYFSEERKPVQKTYNLSSSCNKVVCALEEIYGKELGARYLYLMVRYGFNGVASLFDYSDQWEVEEIDTLLGALSDVPSFLLPLQKNHQFTHFLRGRGNGTTIANASFSFFDAWNEKPLYEQRYTMVHELGHYIASVMSKADDSKEWLALSFWKKISLGKEKGFEDFKFETDIKNTIVSKYGETNPAEDFAESFATYRYNGQYLKAVNPEKYNFLKNYIFNGLEYLDENGCQEKKAYCNSFLCSSNKEKEDELLFSLGRVKMCGNHFAKFLAYGKKEKLIQCLNRQYQARTTVNNVPRLHPTDIALASLQYYNKNIKNVSSAPYANYNPLLKEYIELFIDGLQKKLGEGYSFDKNETLDRYCNRWDQHANQQMSGLEERFEQLYSYYNRDEINLVASKFCEKYWEKYRGEKTTRHNIRDILFKIIPTTLD